MQDEDKRSKLFRDISAELKTYNHILPQTIQKMAEFLDYLVTVEAESQSVTNTSAIFFYGK